MLKKSRVVCVIVVEICGFCLQTELDVYAAMKKWIDHKRPERIPYLETLIDLIRFAHMTRDELVQCTQLDPSYMEFLKVKELLATANWYVFCNVNYLMPSPLNEDS